MSLSTHVLDAADGAPARGVRIQLSAPADDGWDVRTEGTTDDDGRWRARDGTGDLVLEPGRYRLSFDTGAYFAARDRRTFYPEVAVVFEVVEAAAHHHVPLLLSPFAYSTYRGS